MPDPLSSRELAAFVAAVETGSVQGAAEALDLTQSATTKRIQALERRLGVALLRRGRRGVRPTQEGRALFPEAPPGHPARARGRPLDLPRVGLGDARRRRRGTGDSRRGAESRPLAGEPRRGEALARRGRLRADLRAGARTRPRRGPPRHAAAERPRDRALPDRDPPRRGPPQRAGPPLLVLAPVRRQVSSHPPTGEFALSFAMRPKVRTHPGGAGRGHQGTVPSRSR